MADFEDNPFADPKDINPFADPSVKAAATDPPPSTEEYNPFAEQVSNEAEVPILPPPPTKPPEKQKQKKQTKPKGPVAPEPAPAVLPTEPSQYEPPPQYQPAPSSFGRDDELKKREEELARRESELQDRERNLSRLGSDARPKNFPPLPKFCPCQPCFYINVSEEIPPGERWKVRLLIGMLAVYFLVLCLNLLFAIIGGAASISKGSNNNNNNLSPTAAIVNIVMGIVWVIILPVAALFCWVMPAYYAYRKDSSLSYMWFFFILVIQCVVWAVFGLGPPGFSCGIISGVNVYSISKPIGLMWIILGIIWFFFIPLAGFMIWMVHRYYRSSGRSLDQAAGEAVRGAAGNKYVRDAVKSGVKTGVSAAMSGE